jgi:hypothetical protein
MEQVSQLLCCDGCGQLGDSLHIARRLQRLEWKTRLRPIHIQNLVVSGISPRNDDEFLYTPGLNPQGEAQRVLAALQIPQDRNSGSVLAEVQKQGFFLIHVLECPLSGEVSPFETGPLLENQLPAVITRIRRSLKPKRVVLISPELAPFAGKLLQTDLGCPILPATGGVLLDSNIPTEAEFQAFRAAVASSYAQTA